MIKILKQTTEYYCSTEQEADSMFQKRIKEAYGEIIKRQIDVKDNYTKLTITEEYNVALDLSKDDPRDPNEYYDLFDENLKMIEHKEESHE